MQKLMIATGLFLASAAAFAGTGAQWGYSGAEGPEHWGELSQKFTACSEGRNQSPIDLGHFTESELAPIGIHYQAGGDEIVNNGHSVQVNYAPGSKISVDGHEFTLKQFHFHSPSENRINGKSYPMEAHLVHADAEGNLAVVAVMFEQGKMNEALAQAWAQMPEKAGDSQELASRAAAEDILPASRDYYRYNGSLTTPPCSEGVEWLVMKEPVTASKAQIEKFEHVMHHPNNRPIQVVGARPVLQ